MEMLAMGTERLPTHLAIAGALTAYACGDGFGLPWEGSVPGAAEPRRAVEIPSRRGWLRGGTSDDTALTLLVARHLITHAGAGDPGELLRVLAEQVESIPGLGPSTLAAIGRFQRSGELPSEGGRTNGAVMRALPAGWATAVSAAETRRRWVILLSSATHPDPEAQAAACVAAACASAAIEGADGQALLTAALEEATALRICGLSASAEHLVQAVRDGGWAPPSAGVGLDPLETLGAVLYCVATGPSLAEALLTAVALGGDTDTVAALTAGILGCRFTPDQVRAELPWSQHLHLPPPATIQDLADGLCSLRGR
jgi:ADP-ribosylglycohydrolase